MAIEFDAAVTKSRGSGASDGINITIAVNDNRILIVGVTAEDSSSTDVVVSSITHDGVALTKITSVTTVAPSPYTRSELWYLLNPASGTKQILYTLTGTCLMSGIGVISIYGAVQQAPEVSTEQFTKGVEAEGNITTQITTISNNAMVIDHVGTSNLDQYDATGPTEKYDSGNTDQQIAGGIRTVVTPGAVDNIWTNNSGRRTHVLAAFEAFISTYHIRTRYITAHKNMSTHDIQRMKNDFPNVSKGDRDGMKQDSREIMKDFE